MRSSNRFSFWLPRLLAAALLAVAFAAVLRAAETNAPAPSGSAEFIETRNLIGILKDGGITMIPLVACSCLLLAVVFERAVSLRPGRVIPGPFVKRFLHQLREGELDPADALSLCEENGSPVAGVFAAAIRKWGRASVEVEQAILDSGERAANELRRYLRVLNGIATVSPLLGLLGTVFGIIRSFNSIATASAMGRPELLANGIAEALITTATGLTIAIPALICYLLFLGRVDKLVMQIDALGQEIVNIISAEGTRPSARSRASRSGREAA
jgi:biopolymer transport protein ExbB